MFLHIAAAAGVGAGGDGGRFSVGGGQPLGAQAVLHKVAKEVLLRQHGEEGGDEFVVVVHAPAVVWMPRNARERVIFSLILVKGNQGEGTQPPSLLSPPGAGQCKVV